MKTLKIMTDWPFPLKDGQDAYAVALVTAPPPPPLPWDTHPDQTAGDLLVAVAMGVKDGKWHPLEMNQEAKGYVFAYLMKWLETKDYKPNTWAYLVQEDAVEDVNNAAG